jgi:hypothetical protein
MIFRVPEFGNELAAEVQAALSMSLTSRGCGAET